MCINKDLLEALIKFNERYEHCHIELSDEIQISELKIKQFQYLEIIHRNTYLTFSRFAEILKITKPSVTSIINQLIKLQCVQKSQCSLDGRKFYIQLSSKGESIVAFGRLKQKRLAEKISMALIESEIETLIRILNKISNS